MLKKYKLLLSIPLIIGALGLSAAVSPVSVYSVDPKAQAQEGVNSAGGAGQNNLQGSLTNVINILLFLVGIIAVIMIVVGGLRYVLSNGDSSAISAAKNTVLYAVIGLVVAILAYAIINFVLTNI